jgi:hypothetical protein
MKSVAPAFIALTAIGTSPWLVLVSTSAIFALARRYFLKLDRMKGVTNTF